MLLSDDIHTLKIVIELLDTVDHDHVANCDGEMGYKAWWSVLRELKSWKRYAEIRLRTFYSHPNFEIVRANEK